MKLIIIISFFLTSIVQAQSFNVETVSNSNIPTSLINEMKNDDGLKVLLLNPQFHEFVNEMADQSLYLDDSASEHFPEEYKPLVKSIYSYKFSDDSNPITYLVTAAFIGLEVITIPEQIRDYGNGDIWVIPESKSTSVRDIKTFVSIIFSDDGGIYGVKALDGLGEIDDSNFERSCNPHIGSNAFSNHPNRSACYKLQEILRIIN